MTATETKVVSLLKLKRHRAGLTYPQLSEKTGASHRSLQRAVLTLLKRRQLRKAVSRDWPHVAKLSLAPPSAPRRTGKAR